MKTIKTTRLVLILLAIVCLVMAAILPASAQTAKPDTAKKKYDYFITLPVGDYQQLIGGLNEYKRLQVYDPIPTDAQKIQAFKNIEAYLRDIGGRVKVDSLVRKAGGK